MLSLEGYSGKICAKMPEYGPNMPEYSNLKCPNVGLKIMPEWIDTKMPECCGQLCPNDGGTNCPNTVHKSARMLMGQYARMH